MADVDDVSGDETEDTSSYMGTVEARDKYKMSINQSEISVCVTETESESESATFVTESETETPSLSKSRSVVGEEDISTAKIPEMTAEIKLETSDEFHMNRVDCSGDTEELKEKQKDVEDGLKKTLVKGAAAIKNLFSGCVTAEDVKTAVKKSKGDKTEITSMPEVMPEEKIIEQPAQPDEDVYDFSHPKRGRAIIINNKTFHESTGFNSRPGTEEDGRSLKDLFRKLGFDVAFYEELSAQRIFNVLQKEAREYDHDNADCLVVAILSHGDSKTREKAWLSQRQGPQSHSREQVHFDVIIGVDGKAITTECVLQVFSDINCKGLTGKPRLFFFQACRGNEYDEGLEVRIVERTTKDQVDGAAGVDSRYRPEKDAVDFDDYNSETDEKDAQRSFSLPPAIQQVVSPSPLFKDFLVMYATTPGHFAWRRVTGSWFIQSLYTVFIKDLHPNMSLTQALTRVMRMVAQEYESKADQIELMKKKQIPVLYSMLVKDIYLMDRKRKSH